MDIGEPVVIGAAIVAGFGGFFVGRLMATRLIGGCLVFVLGIAALVVLVKLLLGDSVPFLGNLTQAVTDLVTGQVLAALTFVAGFAFGIMQRRRAG
jgi:hypothetical protein